MKLDFGNHEFGKDGNVGSVRFLYAGQIVAVHDNGVSSDSARFAQGDNSGRAERRRNGETPRRVPQFCGIPSRDGTRGDRLRRGSVNPIVNDLRRPRRSVALHFSKEREWE